MWNWIKKSEIWENIVLIIGVFSLWPTIALRDKPLEAYSGWVGVDSSQLKSDYEKRTVVRLLRSYAHARGEVYSASSLGLVQGVREESILDRMR